MKVPVFSMGNEFASAHPKFVFFERIKIWSKPDTFSCNLL